MAKLCSLPKLPQATAISHLHIEDCAASSMLSRADRDHDVSILIPTVDAAGPARGEEPRWNVSMTIMRPPQQGHGCESGLGSLASAQ